MINKVTLVGNLGRDPELRRLESGAAVAQFSIATTENYKDRSGEWKSQTEWHDIVLWRNLADRAESQLKKGMLIYLEGKLSTRKWEDKDGNPRKTTEIVGSYLRILNRREDLAEGPSVGGQAAPSQPASPSPSITLQGPTSTSPSSDAIGNDDLPF
ncbi:MAG: single-stranded DNA-binding protein [Saprospiraceae bacterium]